MTAALRSGLFRQTGFSCPTPPSRLVKRPVQVQLHEEVVGEIEMSSVQAFRASQWQVLCSILLATRWCTAGPVVLDGALQDLKELNLTQAWLVADNATLKCSLTPNLCDWQLHLYEGHSFSVPLLPAAESTTASVRETTQATTDPGLRETFGLTPPGTAPQLFIVAEVEPKSRREMRRKRKLARRTTFNYSSKRKFILLVFQ